MKQNNKEEEEDADADDLISGRIQESFFPV